MNSGTGEYEGYNDKTESSGRYEIDSSNETVARIHAVYSWSYENSEGKSESGKENRFIELSIKTRKYTSQMTDLDEYDEYDALNLSIWFWIPPNVNVGDKIQILDDTFTVIDLDVTVWSNWLPKKAIMLQATGTGKRDDEYGTFTYAYTDTYYFDQNSGYIIAERYREEDSGSWKGKEATFVLTEKLDVTSTSYPITIDYISLTGVVGSISGVVLLCVFISYKIRWRTIKINISPYGEVRIYRIRGLRKFQLLQNNATKNFGPYLEDFVNKALLARDIVAVATFSTAIIGFAVYNREAKIGTILCESTEVTETLRRYIGIKDFFSEVRHSVSEKIMQEAAIWGTQIENPNAYNVFDTYQILMLDNIPEVTYDTALISRMKEEELPEIEKIAKKVYGVKSRRWLKAQFQSGDVGFVARVDGKIVGFSFATYANGQGRIHTLTVLPEYRGLGIGKELMRARLRILYDMGVASVITEIAYWNLASLQIAYNHGFKQVGTMYVETARTQRIKKNIVRR
ncbi:MAG: GNAT family N-acetyltransferase [Candidatus Thermoplasmatota archaeon]